MQNRVFAPLIGFRPLPKSAEEPALIRQILWETGRGPDPLDELAPKDWLDALPKYVQLSRPSPWIMQGLSGYVLPPVYEIIVKMHESRLRQQASNTFDEAYDTALRAFGSPRHPSQNVFQPSDPLYDGLVVFKVMVSETPAEVMTPDDVVRAHWMSAYEIIEGIMACKWGRTFKLGADTVARSICQNIHELEHGQ